MMDKDEMVLERVHKEERQRRIELMLLRGVTSMKDMTAAFGVDRSTIIIDINEIKRDWAADRQEAFSEIRDVREKQLEHIYFLSLQAFERSRIGETVTDRQKKVCTWCNGEGREEHTPNHWIECTQCSGEGQIEFESKSNQDLPGDAIFLRLAKDMVVEMMKVDGIYPQTISGKKTMVTSQRIGGDIQVAVEELYLEADPEVLMRAMRVMDELDPAKVKTPTKIIEHKDPEGKKR